MKKFIIALSLLLITCNFSFADELRLDKEMKYQKKLMETGFRILNANQIDKRITFRYSTEPQIKAKCKKVTKRVVVYKGLFPFIDDADEVAAILSRNIALGVEAYGGPFKRMSMSIFTKKYARKADLKAVDYMVNAGYNPVALIVLFNKFLYEPNWYDFGNVDDKGSTRMLRIYEYILNNYPQYLVENEFENNIYYQNFLITTKKEREKIGLRYKKKHPQQATQVEKNPTKEDVIKEAPVAEVDKTDVTQETENVTKEVVKTPVKTSNKTQMKINNKRQIKLNSQDEGKPFSSYEL